MYCLPGSNLCRQDFSYRVVKIEYGEKLRKEEAITDVKKIYFDMDGVLADFVRGTAELCHIAPVDQSKEYICR